MKILFIDAFKPNYVEHAPYLKSLTQRFQHGHVITPLGFWGGMESFYKGKSRTVALYCRSYKSSLWWTKHLYFLGNLILSILLNILRLIQNKRPFFRICKNMPLDKLYLFDISINNILPKKTEHQIISFYELDNIGHRYGPDSKEIIEAVKKLDKKIKNTDFDLLISDHGMGKVEKTIDVPRTAICFIDATMARYWDEKPYISEEHGKWIQGNERFGNFIFLANPRVLIAPSYWSNGEEQGMHGWDPNHPDMHAFYLLKKSGKRIDKTMEELHQFLNIK